MNDATSREIALVAKQAVDQRTEFFLYGHFPKRGKTPN
jgi:hypothetical protein